MAMEKEHITTSDKVVECVQNLELNYRLLQQNNRQHLYTKYYTWCLLEFTLGFKYTKKEFISVSLCIYQFHNVFGIF